jgi:drug/metabolite transporter (DMT)-like permease
LGEVPLSILCGALFGSFLVLLHQTGDDSGLWPLTASFLGGVVAVAVLSRLVSSPLITPRVVAPMMLAAGTLGATGGVLYVIATRSGLLSVVAVLSSLYPAVTVGLARIVLHERFGRVQTVGLGLAVISVVLLGTG